MEEEHENLTTGQRDQAKSLRVFISVTLEVSGACEPNVKETTIHMISWVDKEFNYIVD